MSGLKSHEDLVAWQLSEKLKDRVYEFLERPRAQKDGDFCADFRRAARSGPANLAEGFHRYRPRENARFVRIALGSLGECLNHLGHAYKQRIISSEEHVELMALANRARRASLGWLSYLDSCPPDGPDAANAKLEPNLEPNPEPNPEPNSEPNPRTEPRTPNRAQNHEP